DFYKKASSEGLLAPSSQLLNATAIATPPAELPKGHMGIVLAGNWFSDQWIKSLCAPCWPDAPKVVGMTPFPTVDARSPTVASTLAGWGFAVYANTPNADAAWQFIQVAQRRSNMLGADIEGGWVPPVKAYAADKEFLDVQPAFRAGFAALLPQSVAVPSKADYPIWANGFLQATEAAVLTPDISTDDAVQKLS